MQAKKKKKKANLPTRSNEGNNTLKYSLLFYLTRRTIHCSHTNEV